MVTFSRLMFLGAAVMIYGENHGVVSLCSLRKPNGGPPAVASDLKKRADLRSFKCPVI